MLAEIRRHLSFETALSRENGWLKTGDQGVRLPGGYVKFLSRLKDVIRVGGENVSPFVPLAGACPGDQTRMRG